MNEVIKILNQFAILIDYGSKDGAVKGDKVRVFVKGKEIYNNKNKFLGTLDIIKDELEITTVYEHFSICEKIKRTSKTIQRNPFEIYKLSGLMKSSETKTDVEKLPLNVNKEDFTNDIFKTDEPIKKGDLVKILKK